MAKMALQWRIPNEELAARTEAFASLMERIGESAFECAVERLISESTSRSFPRPGDLRAYAIDSGQHEDRSWWRDPNCPKCHGAGWFYVADHEANRLYDRTDAQAVLRCRQPNCLHRR